MPFLFFSTLQEKKRGGYALFLKEDDSGFITTQVENESFSDE
jgi:hypothetical protein